MFNKLKRTKVFRDPLYGYIEVELEVIAKLIDSKEVQRLRRIRQLSGVCMVFQTAEHSRFCHALGTYQMAKLVIDEVEGAKENLSEYEQVLLLVSALLHDVGHGPYSHAFEHILDVAHEEMSARIITYPNGDIYNILKEYNIDPLDVANIIRKKSKYKVVEQLISSQLDVDRLDYLSRDAYFTGATYGTIDRNRLLRSLIINKNQVYVRASGLHSVESYLMSRYHMYFQVYYHPVARAYELLLETIYLRIKDLSDKNIKINANLEDFLNVIKNSNNIESYIEIDDSYVNGFIKQLLKCDDLILNEFANALEKRHLFKYIEIDEDNNLDEIKQFINKKYYYYESSVSAVAYLTSKGDNSIKILLPNGKEIALEDYSKVINALAKSSYKEVKRIYYFEG